jgi:hypothetical protein
MSKKAKELGFIVTHIEAFHKMHCNFIGDRRIFREATAAAFIARYSFIARYCGCIHAICFVAMIASVAAASARGQSTPLTMYGNQGFAQAPDLRWVETLISDGFPRVALKVSESRMQLHMPDSDAHAQWMMLAMHSQAAVDLDAFDFSSDPKKLDAMVSKLDAISANARGTPRELWIRWKSIWCRWLVQQRGLASYLAAPRREPLKLWIIGSIRASLDAVEDLEQEVRKLPTGIGKAIPNEQRLDLQGRLALLRADLLYQRSQCYPVGSEDRSVAATEMLQSLNQAMSKLPADWVHRPSLAIARIRGQIQLGNYDDAITSANTLWESLLSEQDARASTIQYEGALAVVGARAARFKNQVDEFNAWIARGGGALASPELALEQFSADLQWGGDQAAEKALDWKRTIGKKFGSYWEQRMDALLVSSHGTAKLPTKNPSLEILRIEVRQLLAAKRWDEAIEKLRQAEFAAAQLHAEDEAFAFGMQVAAAHDSRDHREEAATAFFEMGSKYPGQPKAAAASLMGAWLIRPSANPGTPQPLEQSILYRERLRTTASQWPQSDAAKQAVDWFERDSLARDNLAPVLDLWDARCRATRQSSSAIGRFLLGVCLRNESWLEPVREPIEDRLAPLAALRTTLAETYNEVDRDQLRGWIASTESELRWTLRDVQGDSTTWLGSLARLDSSPADAILAADAKSTQEALRIRLAPWNDDPLARLGVLWFACESRALAILSRPTLAAKQEYQRLDALARLLQEERRGESVYPLGPTLEGNLQRAIRFYDILAAGGDGDWNAVLKQLEKEREMDNRSAWWLYRSARVMQAIEAHRPEAIPQYRLMASGFPAGSEPWLEARARTAQTLRWSNDAAAADQLRDLVLATYPKAESQWRLRFEAK